LEERYITLRFARIFLASFEFIAVSLFNISVILISIILKAIYKEAISSEFCERIKLTSVETEFPECDTFFPQIPASRFRMISRSPLCRTEDGIAYRFTELERIGEDAVFNERAVGKATANEEEMQYLRLIDDIIKNGVVKGDRTGYAVDVHRIACQIM